MPARFTLLVTALAAALVLSACANTVRGVGRDVQATGQAIDDVTPPN
jgi:predicted small secreted protein